MTATPTQRLAGVRLGVIGGVCLVLLSLIGMVHAFNQREIVSDVISMGQTLLLFTSAFIAYMAVKRTSSRSAGPGLACCSWRGL